MIATEFDEPIDTARLRIRLMTERDVDDIHSYQGRDDVCRYLLYDARSRDQVAEQVARHALATRLAEKGDYWQLAIERRDDGRVIGDLYFTISSVDDSTAEIGWVLHPDAHGAGFASEAASALLDAGFERVALHRIKAELDPRNAASIALCRRLGMRQEAHFVKDLRFRGEWADTGVFAILHEEWRARADARG